MAKVISIDAYRPKTQSRISAPPEQPAPPPKPESGLEALAREMRKTIKPEGAIEEMMFHRIVHATWQLRRCDRAEANGSTETGGFRKRAQLSLTRWSAELRKLRQRRGVGLQRVSL